MRQPILTGRTSGKEGMKMLFFLATLQLIDVGLRVIEVILSIYRSGR